MRTIGASVRISRRRSRPRSTRRRRPTTQRSRARGAMSTRTEALEGVELALQELTYREAVRLALEHEMEQDPAVLLLGEDVADAGGVFKTSEGLLARFGPGRVIDTPIAENCFTG